MFFKKSKKKQLANIKYEICMLRAGMEVQKEHAVHLAENYTDKQDYSQSIANLYDYLIEHLKEIENIK